MKNIERLDICFLTIRQKRNEQTTFCFYLKTDSVALF